MKKSNSAPNNPITEKHEVPQSNDERIDEDFKGFPHAPAKEETINPKTKNEKITAGVEKNKQSEQNSDGSAGAFEATENMEEDDDVQTRLEEK